MLKQVSINNYALVEQLDLDIPHGMTVITGATGAGKSIMLDALGLAVGDRADSTCIRPGAKQAEVRVNFDISFCPKAQQWLKSKRIETTENDCILHRIVTLSGRSRAYINGASATLSDLKSIGKLLIDIHNQHAHQSLLKKHNHHLFLDNFANTTTLATKVTCIASEYNSIQLKLNTLSHQEQEQHEHTQLLSYQLQEFEALALTEGEIITLEKEYRELINATETLETCCYVSTSCADDESTNVLQQLSLCTNKLSTLKIEHPRITHSIDMLLSARIQIEEALGELNYFTDDFNADPQRIHIIEERLNAIYDLARKHRIQPNHLMEKQQSLVDELDRIQSHDKLSEALEAKRSTLLNLFQKQAKNLSEKRKKAALQLEKAITSRIKHLGMDKGLFKVELTPITQSAPSSLGLEDVEFLVTTNIGQPLRPLIKVASGGELSRISLAIQVATAKTSHTTTLVFDEVDVGIGGSTAEVVGRMLRELGEQCQILCVTHQPQVASLGHNHLHANKKVIQSQSQSHISRLVGEVRIQEIARMLGGIEITQSTLAHAKEMLDI